MARELDTSLEYAAAKLGVEWATKVRETFRQLGTSIPPAWPGTRAGARSLGDWLCQSCPHPRRDQKELEHLASIIDRRATQAWRQIRCWSGELMPQELERGSAEVNQEPETPLKDGTDRSNEDRTGSG